MAGGDGERTFTFTVVPNATSNLHSEPWGILCWLGALVSTRAVSSRPGRDIAWQFALQIDGVEERKGRRAHMLKE